MSGELIDKKLAQQPIILPGNPVVEVLKSFGRDELVAMLVNMFGVGILSVVTDDQVLLALAGPVIEKLGFFAHSSVEAGNVYRTTPYEDRNSRASYVADAIRNGMPNMLKDMAFHDPLYTGLMLAELQQFPETPVWMLAIVAFMISVGIIATAEVATKEVLYTLRKEQLQRQGFNLEKHYEARFKVDNISARRLLKELADSFDLGEIHTSTYHDTYYHVKGLRSFNGREPNVRLRRRREHGQDTSTKEIQLIYTRSTQINKRQPEQHNFYPVEKDKFKLAFEQGGEAFLESVSAQIDHEVYFTRDYAYITGEMFISTDQVSNGENPFAVVEIKSRRDEEGASGKMVMAMRHTMLRYDVIQTTLSKRILTDLKKN